MLEIVLSPVKAQQFTVTLGAQVCIIRLNQRKRTVKDVG